MLCPEPVLANIRILDRILIKLNGEKKNVSAAAPIGWPFAFAAKLVSASFQGPCSVGSVVSYLFQFAIVVGFAPSRAPCENISCSTIRMYVCPEPVLGNIQVFVQNDTAKNVAAPFRPSTSARARQSEKNDIFL
jgi:hypothetical protein